jgi:hypothetical protein
MPAQPPHGIDIALPQAEEAFDVRGIADTFAQGLRKFLRIVED